MPMRRKAALKGKQRKAPEQRKTLKPGKMKPGKQKASPVAATKKRRAVRYPGMKCQSRNVPVKKNAHSILMIRIARSARGITAYVNM